MSNKTSKILMVGVLLITSLAFVGTANASWFSDWYNVYFGKKTSVTTVSDQPSVGARTSNYWDEIAGSYMRPNYPSGEGLLIYGSNKYINFGSTYGTNGYGVRDNSGTIECKNNGGSWGACGSGSGGSGGGLNIQGSVSIGQIPYFNTTATSTAVATSTSLVTCTGSTSCGSGSYVIGNPLTITSTAGGSGTISTSSPLTAGLLVQSTAWNTIANIATNTLNIALSDTMGTLAVNRGGTGLTSGYNNSNWDTAYKIGRAHV